MSSLILVLGGNGQIGWELQRTLMPLGLVKAPSRAELDLSNFEDVVGYIRSHKPALIVNAAAYTAVDAAEDEAELAQRTNADLPEVLATEAQKAGTPIVHYSTDYVFDGLPHKDGNGQPRGYREFDPVSPKNTYGRSKLAGETAITQIQSAHLVFRTAWVYSERRHNFYRTMLRLASEREELRVVDDQIGSPTWARQIAGTTALILARFWRPPGGVRNTGVPSLEQVSGLYHLTAAGSASWHGFATAIIDRGVSKGLIDRRPRIINIPSSDFPTPALRPAWSVLDNSKLSKTFGIVMTDWQSQLDLCMDVR